MRVRARIGVRNAGYECRFRLRVSFIGRVRVRNAVSNLGYDCVFGLGLVLRIRNTG